ncbi:MAG: helical backbone metal receptor, partial [Gemmatimonadaceae bacterium]
RAARVAQGAAAHAPVSFAYLIWRAPWMTVNGDTFVDGLLSLAGGRNVFTQSADRYPSVTVEQLRNADPALVLLSSEPFPFTELHADELAELTQLPRQRFQLVDGELLSWHGSRTPRGIDYAESVIVAGRR